MSALRGNRLGSYRRRLDIIADMLTVISQRPKKTQIMYQANLSYLLLTRYLAVVRKAYLITFERKQRCYALTSKGQRFLEIYKEYSRRRGHIEKQLDEANSRRKALESLCSNREPRSEIMV
jgi:predicted transcriptional regulator